MFIVCDFNEKRVGYDDAYSNFQKYDSFKEALNNIKNHNVLIRERGITTFRNYCNDWKEEFKQNNYKLSILEYSDYVFFDFEKEKFVEWIYKTGREEPEILGSGSMFYDVKLTKNMEEAFQLYTKNHRNFLTREIWINRQYHIEYYDNSEKVFIETR